jgi:hypothetical protein
MKHIGKIIGTVQIEGVTYPVFAFPEPGRAEGPVQQLVAAAAERTGPETQPDRAAPAVAPGEAEALLQAMENKAARSRKEHRKRKKVGDAVGAADAFGMAAAYFIAAEMVRETFNLYEPKPDSGARNERSGRRNARAVTPGANEKPLK